MRCPMGTRKQFTLEFKREAVQGLEDGSRPALALAHAFGGHLWGQHDY